MTPAQMRKKVRVGSRVRLERGTPIYRDGLFDAPVRITARPAWVNVNLVRPGQIGWIGTARRQFIAALLAVEDIEDLS